MDILDYKTILVAEDDDFMRRVLAMVLTRMGAWVIECADGQQAVAALNKQRIDIALLDVLMPKVNGLCVLHSIRAGMTMQDFAMPTMLLTATRDEASVYYARKLSCNGFLLKPVNEAELASRLSKIITQHMALPYKPFHYRKVDVGPPDKPPVMPSVINQGLTVAELDVGMVFSAPVIGKGRIIAPSGTQLTVELLMLLRDLEKMIPIEPMLVHEAERSV